MKYVGYYNGEIGPLEEMKIPMLDRAVYFGDGCYDATTFAHNHIFAVKDHVDRFYNSCKMLEIPFDMPREVLVEELQNYVQSGYLYVPAREDQHRAWGERNGGREVLRKRNKDILDAWQNGVSMETLADQYCLSIHAIRKIIYQK